MHTHTPANLVSHQRQDRDDKSALLLYIYIYIYIERDLYKYICWPIPELIDWIMSLVAEVFELCQESKNAAM